MGPNIFEAHFDSQLLIHISFEFELIEVLFFANFQILVLVVPVGRARARPDSVHSSKTGFGL